MQYFITFTEGIISFLSPCMLPMLPVYLTYFAGGQNKKQKTFLRALAFTAGFTLTFCLMGLFAGTVGAFLRRYRTAVQIVSGTIVVLFGLSYLEVFRLPFFKGIKEHKQITGVFTAFVFGLIYSVSLTPCVGAFLGSALMLASVSASAWRGVLLLLVYSLGMAIPFLLSALLLEKLTAAFTFIKKHYKTVNAVCGGFLILVGVLMACGVLNRFLTLLQ